MNFLQLCQRTRSECGITSSGPTAVTGQTGELQRIVNWVADAYQDIQDRNDDWNFLREDFSFNCVVGQSVYPRSTVTNLANWKRDSLRIYLSTVNDERWLPYRDWETFRDTRLRGASRNQTGRPIEFTIDPSKQVILWPIPNDTYTIVGEFFRTAHVMTADTDEPLFDRYQLVIVWDAVMRHAAWISDPALYAHAQKEYGKLINRLDDNESQEIKLGGALA